MSDTVRTRRAASYKEAVAWVANCEDDVSDAVLARFVSDVFKRPMDEVVADVRAVLNPKPRGKRGRPSADGSEGVEASAE